MLKRLLIVSGQTTRNLGEIIYLEAQLYDEEASLPLRVIADILDGAGVLVTTVELTHTSKGVFLDAAYVMPNEPILFAKYYVYDPDGVTPRTDDYGIVAEKFVLEEDVVSVTTTIVVGDALEGELISDDLLVGSTSDDTLTGELIKDLNLEGTTSDTTLIGEVICE